MNNLRPKAKNAFSHETIRLWCECLEMAEADDAVWVVIVTGKGVTFCSGRNIRDIAAGKLGRYSLTIRNPQLL